MTIISYEAKKAIEVGRANHWRFSVIEKAKEWVYEEVDEVSIGLDRINALRAAGIGIRGFVVAHEAPRLLMPPKVEKKDDFKINSSIPQFDFLPIVFLIFEILFRAILLDPALIVVLEDGTWLEVMTWYD
jgi:hypothetical protein